MVPRTEYDALHAQIKILKILKIQLDWFKRQLFGARSGKRLEVDPAIQAYLLAAPCEALPKTPEPETEKITYEWRKSRGDNAVTDTGL